MMNVNVYGKDGKTVVGKIAKPKVFDIELRPDMVMKTFACVNQNSRQPYAVSPNAGMQHSAESWGTGRAIAKVPRVKGSGTRRSGQGAFANFARKGRMAHPTKTHRRWHKKTPLNTRRLVTAMGVAASGHADIVEARGHRITGVASLPLVVSDTISDIRKTQEAYQMLQNMNLEQDLKKVRESKTITCGKGKFRGRRYSKRTGLLIVHDNAALSAFSNIEGVELANVNSLNLLRLCPGGHLGRLILWTESAFKKLEVIFSSESKHKFNLPNKMITESSLEEYFYSDEIQSLITTPDLLEKERCVSTPGETQHRKELLELW